MGAAGPAGPAGLAGPPGLKWQGTWSGAATYALNDGVQFNGASYISLQAANLNHQPNTSPTFWNMLAQAGATGSTGAAGASGPAGATGAAGATGPAGPSGATGPAGTTGATGAVVATGPTGATGAAGATGPAGPTGPTGPQGLTWPGTWSGATTCALNDGVEFNGASYISIQSGNLNHQPDTSPTFWNTLAEAAAAGSTGAAGASGPAGATGAAGPTGPAGPTGATGDSGTSGVLTGTSSALGGSLLTTGTYASTTVSISGATVGMAVMLTPTTYPGDGVDWRGYVSSSGVVTAKVCALAASTPTSSTYNIRVIP